MLGSGLGTTIDYFCEKAKKRELKASIVALVSDRKGSGVEGIARKFHIPCHIIEYQKDQKETWNHVLLEKVSLCKPDLILLAGFLRKIPNSFLSRFQNRVINSHPSLIPEFSGEGMYGSRVHNAVINSQKEETGASIHIVNSKWDEGPLLDQKALPVAPSKNAVELEERVKILEKELYLQTVLKIISGEIVLDQF